MGLRRRPSRLPSGGPVGLCGWGAEGRGGEETRVPGEARVAAAAAGQLPGAGCLWAVVFRLLVGPLLRAVGV